MRAKPIIHIVIIFAICVSLPSITAEAKSSDPNESTKYLDDVRTFADNVLKYGRDTYGPKHTPLFVDGLNIHTKLPRCIEQRLVFLHLTPSARRLKNDPESPRSQPLSPFP